MRCTGRIFTDKNAEGLNRGQCDMPAVGGVGSECLCKRHLNKLVHGKINELVILLQEHDFKKTQKQYPIVVEGTSYLYEPFSQCATRLKDNKQFFIHSNDGVLPIISETKEPTIYRVKLRNKNIVLWNTQTNELLENDKPIGTLEKDKRTSINIY